MNKLRTIKTNLTTETTDNTDDSALAQVLQTLRRRVGHSPFPKLPLRIANLNISNRVSSIKKFFGFI